MKDQPGDKNGKDCFSTIPRERDRSCFKTKCTQGIGGSRISASVFPDINMLCFSIDLSRLKQSYGVANQNTDDPAHCHSLTFLSLPDDEF